MTGDYFNDPNDHHRHNGHHESDDTTKGSLVTSSTTDGPSEKKLLMMTETDNSCPHATDTNGGTNGSLTKVNGGNSYSLINGNGKKAKKKGHHVHYYHNHNHNHSHGHYHPLDAAIAELHHGMHHHHPHLHNHYTLTPDGKVHDSVDCESETGSAIADFYNEDRLSIDLKETSFGIGPNGNSSTELSKNGLNGSVPVKPAADAIKC